MAQFSSPQVSHKLRLPRPPGACCKATTMASLSSSGKTAIASLKLSQGLWGSPELNLCPLRLLGSDPSRSFAVVRDSAEGTVAGENVDHNKVEDSSLEKFEERDFTGTPYVPVYVMLPVYFDYMRSFRVEFDEFFEEGIISEIEVGLGPCGELRYPSYPEQHGWKYPGIGEFQCYDRYLMKNLTQAAEARGHSFWARVPDNAGSYNSQPHETGFFRDGGDYDSYYGGFFLNWYSRVLIDHGDRVLALANLAFEGTRIATKVSGIHWWYKTASHPAELTAGFYNSCNRDGYAPISAMLKKHEAALNFTCVEMRTLDQHEGFPEALADPEGLVWQVLNAAWDANIPVASENTLTCFDREGYNKILENAKPWNDPDGRHLSAFTYLRLSPVLIEKHNLTEFERFVKRMHGEAAPDV
ncbi:beta-amylase 2, chloroplastic-like isoform X2 [Pyrus x bretschneideri]|uniref:beta-amylase 2, chloroplastic-like isoform X2 n=1 Tax=Pyrus x bretschneideri TaxID=225117 RepID=UPI0020306EB6|nr:beta-amylase 2, chloroplastic-like isoform X2 [Pyrus x bretschneideri]